ncbi:MAG TPA: formate dehydrogenase subunit delta [Candidatus Binataceae bacterium]|nr:formate dehydrogenase subunit delta [Candidatus Binataceae bacterium]
MDIPRLVKMANGIGAYFEAYPDRQQAVNGVADHLRRFWEPRMRRELVDYIRRGDGSLRKVVLEAAAILEKEAAAD